MDRTCVSNSGNETCQKAEFGRRGIENFTLENYVNFIQFRLLSPVNLLGARWREVRFQLSYSKLLYVVRRDCCCAVAHVYSYIKRSEEK